MVSIRQPLLGGALMFASFLFLPGAIAAPSPAYLSFSVPHSSATYPLSINKDLTVTGYYVDSSGNNHGFVRCFDGTITVFDVPDSLQTKPVSINDAGEITGYDFISLPPIDGNSGLLGTIGFIRHKNGYITTFGLISDGSYQYSQDYFQDFLPQPVAINRHGEVVGMVNNNVGGGFDPFFRSTSGSMRSIDVNEGAAYSTLLTGLNGKGDVVGYGADEFYYASGYLWKDTADLQSVESYTGFSYPGSTGTAPTAINDKGEIAGCYNVNNVFHDFLRSPSGTFTKLDPPGTVPSCLATFNNSTGLYDLPSAVSLNNHGTVVGQIINAAKIPIGFVRFPDGRIIPFAIPGSTLTVPAAINDVDAITGYYTKGGKTEGFLALP